MRRCRTAFTLGVALLCGLAFAQAQAQFVLVQADHDSAAYQVVIDAIVSGLGPAVRVVVDTGNGRLEGAQPDLILALGTRSNQRLVEAAIDTPLLSVLLTRSRFYELASRLGTLTPQRPHSGLFLEVSLQTQVGVARRIFPQLQDFGLLYADPQATALTALDTLSVQARRHDYAGNLNLSLRELLLDVDALVAIPDQQVFNTRTIHTVLLSAYRLNRPVIAYARPYVDAGAMLAVYATPTLIGTEAARMAATWLAQKQPPPPRHPQTFSVSINKGVAKALGLQPRYRPDPETVFASPEAIR